jgi:hypothetical protein
VPLDPTGGELCIYETVIREEITPALQARVLLSRARARTFAELLDTRGGAGKSCAGQSPVILRLRYRRSQTLPAIASGCDPEVLSTPAGVEVLSSAASNVLGGLLDAPIDSDGAIRVFDYIGRPLASAAAAAIRHLKSAGAVNVGVAELNDPGVPFGRVVWQFPLAETEQDATSGSVDLIVATHHSPPCLSNQLLGRYQTTGFATGNIFGRVDIIDTSPQACSVTGSLTLTGIARDGRPDTHARSTTLGSALVLSPLATLRTVAHDPAATLAVSVGLSGDNRDDPKAANGLCYSHETVPKMWSITLSTGAHLLIPNGGPGEKQFGSCHGNLGPGFGIGLLGS